MRIVIASFAVLVASLGEACPPSPSPPAPVGDAAPPPQGDASTPALALCANLADAGCAEGMVANCASTVDHALASRLTTVNVPCLTAKHTKVELRACGSFVVCP